MLPGQPLITGASASALTVTLKLYVELLPVTSLAVYSIVVMPAGNKLPLGKLLVWVTVGAASQLSLAVGPVQLTIAPHLPKSIGTGPMLPGQPLITGASASRLTVTVKLHVELFPVASFAVYSIVVVPAGNKLPLARPLVWVTVGAASQLSLAVGPVQLTIAPHLPKSIGTGPMLPGQPLITGASASPLTVTVKVHVELLPATSLAVYSIVVVPAGNKLPLAKPLVCVTVGTASQLSVAVGAVQLTIAPHLPVSIGTGPMLPGQPLITGGPAFPLTVTVQVQVDLLPSASLATSSMR